MKIKATLVSTLLLTTLAFSSCDSGLEDGSNYWSSNTLVRKHLKGAVRTLTEENTTYQFNTDGNVTSMTISYDNWGSQTVYEYENGKLVSQTTTSTDNQAVMLRSQNVASVITYEYNNPGKFIPVATFHLMETGLVPGLSASISDNNRTDYTFHGSDLWIVYSSSTDGGEMIPSDTSVVHYEGSYPKSFSNTYSFFNNITYAANGMFLTYNEGFTGQDYLSTRAYTFLTDGPYMLLHTRTFTDVSTNSNSEVVATYVYNDKSDVLSITSIENPETSDFIDEYSDYVYDSHNNWISRKYRYKNGDTWSDYQTNTRTIEYY